MCLLLFPKDPSPDGLFSLLEGKKKVDLRSHFGFKMVNYRCTSKPYFGWVIVGLAFCSLAFWFGTRTSFSVFYVKLGSEFSWGSGSLAGAQAAALIAAMLSAPLIGALIDRYGPRKIILPGIMLTAAGLILCATMSSLFEFYLYYGVLAGSAVTSVGVVSYSVVIRHWFDEKRGLASGIAVSGMGAGMLIIVPMVQYSIGTWGWRNAFLILGALGGLGLFPATFFLLRSKSSNALGSPLKNKGAGGAEQELITQTPTLLMLLSDQGLRQIITEKTFWYFVSFSFCSSLGVYIILVHSINFLVSKGTDGMLAAVLLALVGAISSVFRILWGLLSDRIGRELAYSFGCTIACLGIVCLLLRDWLGMAAFAYGFSVFFGIGWGATAPAVMAASADIFDSRQYGFIFGLVQAVINLAGAIGAWLGGAIFGHYQSYAIPFSLAIIAMLASCIFIWMAAPRKKYQATWQIANITKVFAQNGRR